MSFSYSDVGATAVGNVPAGFRLDTGRARIGTGDADWTRLREAIMTWELKRRSGFRVSRVDPPRSDADPVEPGDVIHLHVGPFTEPVSIVYTVDEPDRRGYAYGTLPGHPLQGEEAFVVSRDADGAVWLDIRSFSRPATPGWRLAGPALRMAQRIAHKRYLRALMQPG